MSRAAHARLLAACLAWGCSTEPTPLERAPTAAPQPSPSAFPAAAPMTSECDAGDPAFVRRALLALAGRRPKSQGEVDALVDALAELKSPPSSLDTANARRRLLSALLEDDSYRRRWSDFLKDALRVSRTQTKSAQACYGSSDDAVPSEPELARYVRDHAATDASPPRAGFTLKELLASALALDDLSVVYRAHLLATLNRPMTGNSGVLELELARRNDFGSAFEAVYTARDVTCLPCHNSQFSVTASSEPLTNRFWPVPGLFERALFGASNGAHPATEANSQGSDVLRARGMWRVSGVLGASTRAPFGWNAAACGTLGEPTSDDPLGIDTSFGTLRGRRSSVWDLERALRRGVDGLVTRGLEVAADGTIADPDRAFAYLTALNLVDKVWTEVIGSSLTIAHHFPRTQIARDVLADLTSGFVENRFSLRWLLLAIAAHPVFNLRAPAERCGEAAYALPRLFNPWTSADDDPSRRGNGAGDGLSPLSPRLLRRSLHQSLGWPMYAEYPAAGSAEETLALASGFFLRDAEPGRRALDFQGRLAWEAAYGACPPLAEHDFITALVERARATPDASVGDAVAVLHDRLLGEPVSLAEAPLLEALLGAALSSRDLAQLDGQLRVLCGSLVASPAFVLSGLAASDRRGAPRLTAPEDDYAATRAVLAPRLAR